MSDKISGKFHPIPSTIANQRWISIRNIIIYLETKFRPNRRIFVFWRPFWIQNGRHSKSTMTINSQHHILLGNQISPKSEDFFIWRPFCTLVTMATAAILNLFNPPQMLPHTTVDIPTYFYEVWWNESKIFLNPPFFYFYGNCGKVCPTDSHLLAYLVPLDVDVVPTKFHQFLFGE
jgi:hypothetical protein